MRLQQKQICSFGELVFHGTHISTIVFPFIAIWVLVLFRVLYYIFLKKVKWSRYRSGVAQGVGRVIALFFHDRGTRRG